MELEITKIEFKVIITEILTNSKPEILTKLSYKKTV